MSFGIIGLVLAGAVGAFAYVAGWLSPTRLTPSKLVDALAPPTSAVRGYRRNHAKGICFTGVFESNGSGTSVSRARVFESGQYPVLGRFNLGTPDPKAPDGTVRVRGMGLQITADREVWRSAMIDLPFFPVSTPQAFYELLRLPASKDPNAASAFSAAHPEFVTFGNWAKAAPWNASYAETAYNSLNAFMLVDKSGAERAARWSYVPAAAAVPITPADLQKLGPDHLEQEVTERVARSPQRWSLVVTLAETGDDSTNPSKPWPPGRRTVEAGTLIVQKIEPDANGPCRDITFDPTVLPDGIQVSDDPFLAARSAAYAVSYDRRTAEAKDYPRTTQRQP